jgi:uncharacterized protein YjbI with pentapeptide repeats
MPTRFGYESKEALVDAICKGDFVPSRYDMSGVDFSGVTLAVNDESGELGEGFKIDFSGCNLTGANFAGSKIYNCIFRDAILDNASFEGASMEGVNFCRAKGHGISFKDAGDNESRFNDADFTNGDLRGFGLYKSLFYGTNLSHADLRGIDPSRVGFRFTKFDGADLTDGAVKAILEGANITNTSILGARMDSAEEAAWIAAKAEADLAQTEEIGRAMANPQCFMGWRYTDRGPEHIADTLPPPQPSGCTRQIVRRDGTYLRYDDQGRLHCDGAPAVRDKDGNEAWFNHGQKMPEPTQDISAKIGQWRASRETAEASGPENGMKP